MPHHRAAPVAILILGCIATACTTAWWVEDADTEVQALLERRTAEVLGDRADWVIPTEPRKEPEAPEPDAAAPTDQPADPTAPADDQTELLGLEDALETAVRFNRDYQTQREALYLTGLGTTLTRFNFGPLLSASVSSMWSTSEGEETLQDNTASLSASQVLPTGGNLALSSNWREEDWGKSVTLSATQPLLRGLGYEVAYNGLIQAERNVMYAIRDFELFRQNFSIRIVRSFFDLVAQKRTLANDRINYEQAAFDRQRADVLLQMERNEEEDVFRARRRYIEAKDGLVASQAAYKRALDEFKILLGLETSTQIDVKDEEPTFEPVRVDLASAVRAAKHNRLDILTQRQQLEDTRRQLRIAANNLLPDFDIDMSGTLNDQAGTDAESFLSGSVGLRMEIPLQRKAERNSYRSALISLDRAERGFSLALDRLELDVRDQLRQLDSDEQRIKLQEEQIEQQDRAVVISQFRYEQGVIENRDLLDARLSLVNAKNALIRLKATHFIRRLELLRDLGLLFISDDGKWQ